MPDPMAFTLGLLTTWRMTHLFQAEDGPGRLLARFRAIFGRSFMGDLLDCFYCLSVWIALPLAYFLGASWQERLWLWPALSGGACLLQKFTEKTQLTPVYYEEEEP